MFQMYTGHVTDTKINKCSHISASCRCEPPVFYRYIFISLESDAPVRGISMKSDRRQEMSASEVHSVKNR